MPCRAESVNLGRVFFFNGGSSNRKAAFFNFSFRDILGISHNGLLFMEKLKNTFKKNWAIVALIVISAVIYHRWMSFDIFSFADYWFRFPETLKEYFTLSIWRGSIGLGSPNITIWMLLFDALPGIFGHFGFPSNVADKFFIFWPFIFVTPLASFFLGRRILKNDIGAIVAAIAYSFNTYFLAINTQGHFSLSVAGSFAPLVILFFIKALEESRIAFSALSALSFFVVGSYDFRVAYILGFIVFFYFLFSIATEQKENHFKKALASLSVFALLTILFNLYWILAFAKMGSLAANDVLSRDIIDFSLDLPRAMTLFHPFWTGAVPLWFEEQSIPLYFWLVPVFASCGLWFGRKNRNVVFFAIVSMIGIVLTKQTAEPFSHFYLWLHDSVPGFGAFREASKFFVLIAMGYSILIGSFVSWIIESRKGSRFASWGKYAVAVFVSGLFLWNAQSILTGKIGTMFVPKNPSAEDLAIREIVNSKDDFYRTLMVPSESIFSTYSNRHPKMNMVEMEKGDWGSFSKNYGQGDDASRRERIIHTFNLPYFKNILDISSVKYVIAEKKGGLYVDSASSVSGLVDSGVDLEKSEIFENPDYRPHIYATDRMETVHRNLPFQAVEYVQKSPVRYSLTIKDVRNPVWLNFSEAYHPDWKLGADGISWMDAIAKSDYFLPDADHFQNDAKLNSFLIDPEYVKKKFPSGSYSMNSDGSIDIRLTIFFKPQAYLNLGIIAMVAAFLTTAAFLVLDAKKRHNE
ncbi:MAG: hypothetical protein HGB08_02095 [Candidatus Moranbacteria bacterium]|nr:hypothetical protein [Candidatus Moranbacteria bacterium]